MCGGRVWRICIQLAKTEGLTVIADAAEKDRALVESLGADIVVARGDDVADRIREHFPDGVDGLADGAVLNEKAIPAVKDGGAFTAVRWFIGEPQRNIAFTATAVRNYDGEYEKLDKLRQQAETACHAARRGYLPAGTSQRDTPPPRSRRHPWPARDRVSSRIAIDFREALRCQSAPQ